MSCLCYDKAPPPSPYRMPSVRPRPWPWTLCSQCRSEGGDGGGEIPPPTLGETPASVLPASTICFSFFSHLFLPPFPGPGFPDMSHVALLTLKFESHCWNHCQSCNPPALRVLRVFPRNSLSFPAVDSIVRGRSLPQRRKEKASVIGRKEKHTGEEVGRSPREKNNEEIKQCAFYVHHLSPKHLIKDT